MFPARFWSNRSCNESEQPNTAWTFFVLSITANWRFHMGGEKRKKLLKWNYFAQSPNLTLTDLFYSRFFLEHVKILMFATIACIKYPTSFKKNWITQFGILAVKHPKQSE